MTSKGPLINNSNIRRKLTWDIILERSLSEKKKRVIEIIIETIKETTGGIISIVVMNQIYMKIELFMLI